MKFKSGLIIATLLFLPGWYAIIAWSIADARNRTSTMGEMAEAYERAFPLFRLSFTNTILVLLALSAAGLVLVLRIPPAPQRSGRVLRICIGVLGALSTAMLCFSLM